MKIAFDHQIFSMQRYGGISRYVANLATSLANSKHDIKVFAPFHFNAYGKELSSQIIEGHYLSSFPKKTGRLFMAYNRLITKEKIKHWKPEIVHETYYASKTSNTTLCPTIITVHDMIHELFPNSFYKRDKTTYLKKQAVERAQHIICVSHNTKKDLIELFNVDESKVSVAHLGIDQNKTVVSTVINVDKPYLLYVGHRTGYKNFEGFLKAFAHSVRLKKDFCVIAFGSDSFSKEEKEMMIALGLNESHIKHMVGSDDILASLYQQARAFVYPSLYEGFGIPPLEAMVNGCPVVSSNVSSMPEVIGDAAAFFEPLALNEMVTVIEKVAYDEVYRSNLIERGYIRKQVFSWDKCALETISAYHQSM